MEMLRRWRHGARVRRKRTLAAVLQTQPGEDGLACVAMLLGHHGLPSSLAALKQRHPEWAAGTTLRDVQVLLGRYGLQSRAVRCEMKDLGRLALPCVVHWQGERFAVLHRIDGSNYHVRDPAQYRGVFDRYAFECHYCEVALEVRGVSLARDGEQARRVG